MSNFKIEFDITDELLVDCKIGIFKKQDELPHLLCLLQKPILLAYFVKSVVTEWDLKYIYIYDSIYYHPSNRINFISYFSANCLTAFSIYLCK